MDSRVLVIDNDRKEEMRTLDGTRRNVFGKDFSLIMSIEAYRKYIPIDQPFISQEHRIMYVRRGTTHLTINFEDHLIQADDLVLVPANIMFDIQSLSRDFDAYILAFRILNIEEPGLIGYDVRHLQLLPDDRRTIEEYFVLINQIVQSGKPNNKDFDHLITSFLYHIQQLHSRQVGIDNPAQLSRAKQLQADFMQLLVSQDMPVRNVAFYARQLNVSDGYLQSVIKEVSHKPVMHWVNVLTLIKVKAMLADKDAAHSLDAIAEASHLGSASQLIRFFKRETGITPTKYRKGIK